MIEESLYNQIKQAMPIACVDLIVAKESRILIARRNNSPAKGQWWIPGGRIFKNEDLWTAVVRKAKEELGIEVKNARYIDTYSFVIEGIHFISVQYEVSSNGQPIILDTQHSEYKFIRPEDIGQYATNPDLIKQVEGYRRWRAKEQNLEWSNRNKYNSFNSCKGLAYYEKCRGIAKWLEGKGELPAPVECSLDPITYCSLRCWYCNSQRYLWQNPEETKMKRLPGEYMRCLTDFLADWGVRGLCLGGGGESLLNKEAWDLPSYAVARGMEASIVTNGTVMSDIVLENMLMCRWVGFSVDAADRETYRRIHGRDYFDRVIKNIGMLAEARRKSTTQLDIAFKVLILEENADTLYECCKLAKELGVDDFHIRPVDLERKDYRGKQFFDHNIPKLLETFQRCHEEETEDFHVYTVQHKYSPELRVKHDFDQCLASPLVIQCCTNGDVSVCVDHRIENRFKLGAHYPDPEKILDWWGNEHHRQLLLSIKPEEECGRCTWSEYNRQVKEVAILDKMCLAFP